MALIRAAQSAARMLGVNFHKHLPDNHIYVDYPVSWHGRYGSKAPPPPGIAKLLDDSAGDFARLLAEAARRTDLYSTIGEDAPRKPNEPHWDNKWFGPLDACVLMHILLREKPKRYLEIGSGNSTLFTHHAKQFGKLPTTITSVDPEPRAGIDALCDRVIRERLQDIDLSIFDELESGDVLFFDGSHRVFPDSDVTVFFLDVLPRLKPGVWIHIHDIFWPLDYPESWSIRLYSEQYMLGMLLLYAADKYETVFASAFVKDRFKAEVAALEPMQAVEDTYDNSFWLRSR
jgi:hypothetical protein